MFIIFLHSKAQWVYKGQNKYTQAGLRKDNMGIRGEVYSAKVTSGKRTYFFNVKENRTGDLFLNIVESKKQGEEGGFERHSIIIFDEDMAPFLSEFERAVKFMKKK